MQSSIVLAPFQVCMCVCGGGGVEPRPPSGVFRIAGQMRRTAPPLHTWLSINPAPVRKYVHTSGLPRSGHHGRSRDPTSGKVGECATVPIICQSAIIWGIILFLLKGSISTSAKQLQRKFLMTFREISDLFPISCLLFMSCPGTELWGSRHPRPSNKRQIFDDG